MEIKRWFNSFVFFTLAIDHKGVDIISLKFRLLSLHAYAVSQQEF